MKSVCIVDFAGNYNTPGFWADWFPEEKILHFGGAWGWYDPIYCPKEPTEDFVYQYANRTTRAILAKRS
jgi:hypothetical protein